MCYHPGFIAPFIEHKQRRFSINPKDLGFLEWEMRIGFNFNHQLLQPLNRRVSLSFEVLKPGIDFSPLAMKVLDGIFIF